MSISTILKEMRSIGVRSTEKEFMDDPDFRGADLTESFRFIKITNMLGGGRLAVINCINNALQDTPGRETSVFSISAVALATWAAPLSAGVNAMAEI